MPCRGDGGRAWLPRPSPVPGDAGPGCRCAVPLFPRFSAPARAVGPPPRPPLASAGVVGLPCAGPVRLCMPSSGRSAPASCACGRGSARPPAPASVCGVGMPCTPRLRLRLWSGRRAPRPLRLSVSSGCRAPASCTCACGRRAFAACACGWAPHARPCVCACRRTAAAPALWACVCRQAAALAPRARSFRRGSSVTARAGTAARSSQGTEAGRPASSREPVATLPARTISPETDDSAPM